MVRGIFVLVLILAAFGCAHHPDKKQIVRERIQRTNDTFRLFSSIGNLPAVEVDLPRGFEMNRQRGADFDVYYFTNPNIDAALGIYLGMAPNYHPKGTMIQGTAASRPVQWVQRQDKDGFHADTIVNDLFGKGRPQIVLHIFINGGSVEGVENMKELTRSIRLTKSR